MSASTLATSAKRTCMGYSESMNRIAYKKCIERSIEHEVMTFNSLWSNSVRYPILTKFVGYPLLSLNDTNVHKFEVLLRGKSLGQIQFAVIDLDYHRRRRMVQSVVIHLKLNSLQQCC